MWELFRVEHHDVVGVHLNGGVRRERARWKETEQSPRICLLWCVVCRGWAMSAYRDVLSLLKGFVPRLDTDSAI